MLKLAIVIFDDVDKVDISEVRIVDFEDSENLNYDEDVNNYVEWWLCWNYGLNHGYFYEVHIVEQCDKTDVKYFNRDDMY
jgi:hypothetical protein